MTVMQVEDIYLRIVEPLPLQDRLRLATMILNSIPPAAVGDLSEEWSEEDMRDVTIASLRRAATSFGEKENA